MSKKKKQSEEEILDVGEAYSKTEQFFEKNKQTITFGLTAVLIIVAGIVYYFNFYMPPLQKEAESEMFYAQQHFAQDSFRLAMYGDNEGHLGFEQIAIDYSSTNAGNVANYYMGISLLRTGDYEGAIAYLDRYEANDEITPSLKLGAIGDAYSELGEYEKALGYYEDAANAESNSFTTPIYLKKAGIAAEKLNKYGDAREFYESIKNDYPNSQEGRGIEKFIQRAKLMQEKA
jgi:tetratricopeptide (TPR) repeat protein